MKKMRLKKWVKELLVVLVIGLICVFALSLRARQIDNNSTYNDHAYYEYEMENK